MIKLDEIKERYEQVKPRIDKLTKLYKAGELSEEQASIFLTLLKQHKKDERIVKSSESVLYFTYEYFSMDKNPEYANCLIPANVPIEHAPTVHDELCNLLDDVSWNRKNKRVVWAMPRGHMKSGFMSNIYPVFSIVFDLRKYIIIVSETESMSQKFIEFVNDALKFNQKLRDDFGEFLSPNKNHNDIDNSEMFRTSTGVMVQGASISKQLRGARNGAFRPDLVICDDLESSKNTNTLELRQKNLDWFNKVIIPIGTPEHLAIIYMGTTVHKNGLLTEVLNRADFEGKIYSAIVSPPTNFDMWMKFEEIYRDAENPNRSIDALRFYEENKESMNEGIETLWARRFPYHLLMMEKANIGSKAFSSEFLNNPTDEETAIFKEANFTYFDNKDLFDKYGKELPMDYYLFWDIAIGKNAYKGDYNAIVTIGRDRRTGIIYVIDVFAKRCPMHHALEVMIQKVAEYRPRVAGVETVQAQYDMYRQLQERLAKAGIYSSKIKPIIPRGKKEHRIEQLEPLFENATIRIKRNQRLLIEQLIQFPTADHDDTIDALSQCVDLCGGVRKRRTYYQKPAGI